MTRALVTGVTGFLGTSLCQRLLADGVEVHGVARKLPPDVKAGIRGWPIDLTDLNKVRAVLREVRPEVIFHLAGYSDGRRELEHVLPAFHGNAQATVNLLMAATDTGGTRVVMTASLEEPEQLEQPPVSPYAASKCVERTYATMFHEVYGLPIVMLRVFMAYGPGQSNGRKVIPYCICALLSGHAPRLTSGTREVDWVFIDDVAQALCIAAQVPCLEGETLDIGSGRLVSVRTVVDRIAKMIGAKVSPEYGAIPDRHRERVRVAALDRTRARMGWEPAVDLDEGLARTVRWYEEQLQKGSLAISQMGCR